MLLSGTKIDVLRTLNKKFKIKEELLIKKKYQIKYEQNEIETLQKSEANSKEQPWIQITWYTLPYNRKTSDSFNRNMKKLFYKQKAYGSRKKS